MGTILTDDDLAAIEADMATIIQENPTTLTLRRKGSNVVNADAVRIEMSGGQRTIGANGMWQTRGTVTVLGPKTYDIQNEDRFTYQNQLFEVFAVNPNRQVCTQAKAYLVQ